MKAVKAKCKIWKRKQTKTHLIQFQLFIVWDFPHFVSDSDIYSSICVRDQSVCHVVSTWRVDGVPLAKERTLGTIARLRVFLGRPLVWLVLSAVVLWWILTCFWDSAKIKIKILVNNVAPRNLQLSEENLYLNDFIAFNSRLLLKSAFLYQQPKCYG